MKDLLFSLCNAPCLGSVEHAFAVAEQFLVPFSAVSRTPGRLIAEVPGKGEAILLEAHLDEVGFIVTNILENGFLRVSAVGSVDSRVLPGTPVCVLGEKQLSGVFTSVPPHLTNEQEPVTLEVLSVDVGAENTQLVHPGDFVVYHAPATEMLDGRITAKALDNRSGVAAVLLAAKEISKQSGHPPVQVLLTNGEELGCRGGKTGAAALFGQVACAVSVDVSFGNFAGCDPDHTAVLGSGAMIGISPVLDRAVTEQLKAVARDCKLPHTFEIMSGNTSTNADVIASTGSGIRAGLVSIPLRNMHTPCEVIDLGDVQAVADLLAAFAEKGC